MLNDDVSDDGSHLSKLQFLGNIDSVFRSLIKKEEATGFMRINNGAFLTFWSERTVRLELNCIVPWGTI